MPRSRTGEPGLAACISSVGDDHQTTSPVLPSKATNRPLPRAWSPQLPLTMPTITSPLSKIGEAIRPP